MSGTGKTTLVEYGQKHAPKGHVWIDMDTLGHRAKAVEVRKDGTIEHGTEWVVCHLLLVEVLRQLAQAGAVKVYLCGICRNIVDSVRVKHLDYRSGGYQVDMIKPIAYAFDWDRKYRLWFDPELIDTRFGDDRKNSYGKRPEERAVIKTKLTQWKPRGFEVIDTGILSPAEVYVFLCDPESSGVKPDRGATERENNSSDVRDDKRGTPVSVAESEEGSQ
jgi:hypothetical protein